MKLNTQLLVDRLVQRMDIDRIFLFQFLDEGEESPHLLLVVNPIKGVSVKNVEPIIHLCMSDMPELPFAVIWTGEWSNQLKKGSLYYAYASQQKYQLYQSGKKVTPIVSNKLVRSLLELSHVEYAKGKKVADDFMVACYSFRSKTDYFQATTMLHQFILLRLKGFQEMIGVTIGKSQNLEHIFKMMRSAAPGLFKIFNYDVVNTPLLRLLDTCYVNSKKKDRIAILEEELEALLIHCQLFGKALDEMVDFMWKEIEGSCLKKDSIKSGDVQNDPVDGVKKVSKLESGPRVLENFSGFPWPQTYKDDANLLLDKLYSGCHPEQILLVNYQSVRLTTSNPFHPEELTSSSDGKVTLFLVVLTKRQSPFTFQIRKVGDVSASVVFLDLLYVEKHLALGSRFVNIVWEKSWVLRQKSTFNVPLVPGVVDWSNKLEKIKVISDNAIAVMRNVLKTITDSSLRLPDTSLILLRELHSIGIQTYLRCAVGFIPKNTDLLQLMDWSAITNTALLEGLVGDNELDKLILSIILKPHDIWWKSLKMDMDEQHEKLIIDRAHTVVEWYERLFNDVILSIEKRTVKVNEIEKI